MNVLQPASLKSGRQEMMAQYSLVQPPIYLYKKQVYNNVYLELSMKLVNRLELIKTYFAAIFPKRNKEGDTHLELD